MPADVKIDRYPGPRPFDEAEKDLFFGRSIEIEELVQAINVNDLFVIHGESGLGKSSLINAGLIPRLKEKDYLPVLIRFKENRVKSPVVHVLEQLKKIDLSIEQADVKGFNTIWYWIKRCNSAGIIPALVFDQFEEFGYFSGDERKKLIEEITALLVTGIPDYIKKEAASLPVIPEPDQENGNGFSWFTPPEVKLIFSIRSDRLKVLEEFAVSIPYILRNRFQIKPLTIDQARQTVILPAIMGSFGNIYFNSEPFKYTEELITDIFEVVGDDRTKSVETTHLQMICQEIETISKTKKGNNVIVTQNDLKDLNGLKGGIEGLKELVKNFYKKQLTKIAANADVSQEEYRAARILIEKRLLVANKRVPLAADNVYQFFRELITKAKKRELKGAKSENDEGMAVEETGISDEKIKLIIDLLLSLRLIREQNYGGTDFYEIGHDTLINPILGEMNNREALERASEEAIEQRKRKVEDLRQKKQIQEIQEQKHIAEEARELAEKEKAKAVEARRVAYEEKAKAEALSIKAVESEMRIRKLTERGFYVYVGITILLLFGGYYINKQSRKVETFNKEIKTQIAKISTFEAKNSYEQGNHMLANALWRNAIDVKEGDTAIQRILDSSYFAPFAGSNIQISRDYRFIATKSPDNELSVWMLDRSTGNVSKVFSNGPVRNFFFTSNSNFLFYVNVSDSTKLNAINLVDRKSYAVKVRNSENQRFRYLPKNKLVVNIPNDGSEITAFDFPEMKRSETLTTALSYIKPTSEDYSNLDMIRFEVSDYNDSLFYVEYKNVVTVIHRNTGRIFRRINLPYGCWPAFGNGSEKIAYMKKSRLYIVDIMGGKMQHFAGTGIKEEDELKWVSNNTKLSVLKRTDSLEQIYLFNPITNEMKKIATTTGAYFGRFDLDEKSEQILYLDTMKAFHIYNTQTLVDTLFKNVNIFFADREQKYVVLQRGNTLMSINLQTLKSEKLNFDTDRLSEYSIEGIYGNTFLRLRERKLGKMRFALVYQDSDKNSIQQLRKSFQDYTSRKLDTMGLKVKEN